MRLSCNLLARVFPLLIATVCSAAAIDPLVIPFHRQMKNGCGAASVAMVLHYWETDPPAPDVVYASLYQPVQNGISLSDMRDFLANQGLRAFTLRGEWRDLEQQLAKGRPLVVGLRNGRKKPLHFVVVTGVNADTVWLNDPTRKKPHHIPREKFEKSWNLADKWMLLAVPPAS